MTPERWRQVTQVFHAALAREAPARAQYLDEACTNDAALRAEVEAMLSAHIERASPSVALTGPTTRPPQLESGTMIGVYRIDRLIGAGGMGEVYRARDTKLGRDVAVKVLPAPFTADAERLARFEREARLLAALNHPHIAAIYGFEEAHGVPALILELVEGETLSDRVARGPISIDDALLIARQIAEALEAAHEKGIIHRDLKPANIKITSAGVVKVLDFGLAKIYAGEGAGPDLLQAPTITAGTREGMILGTAAYMSPEQARGQVVDKRTDIWAFGCVLYETLTGRPVFLRDTVSDTIAGILKGEPDWRALRGSTPPKVRDLLRRCLQKDPKRRLHDIADARLELDDVLTATEPPRLADTAQLQGRRRWVRERAAWLLGTGGLTIALLLAVLVRPQPAPSSAGPYRAAVLPPTAVGLPASIVPSGRFALSPDGRRLAFIGTESGGGLQKLWVRTLDGRDAQPLAGTEGAQTPFWSPDSRFIGFRADNKLKTINADGGPTLTLADTGGSPGGTWNSDGIILFGTFGPGNPIRRVSASGGPVSEVTTLDTENGEMYHGYPSFLPDERHFLYFSVGTKAGAGPNGIYVTALDSTERKLLVPGGSNATYAEGYLFFLREQTLMAQPFDVERLEFTGDAVVVAEQVATGGLAGTPGAFTVSKTGVLAYQTGPANVGGQAVPLTQLAWFDRSGTQIEAIGDPAQSTDIELASDGSRAVMRIFDVARRTSDVWLVDLRRGLRNRFTFDSSDEYNPVWSADSNRVVFSSRRKGHFDLYVKASSGAGPEDELLADALDKWPLDWSTDARFILYGVVAPKTGNDLWVLPLFGDRKPSPFLQTAFDEFVGQFSPDGRWVAYESNESGRNEVYVASFPGAAGKWQISNAGGGWPRWRGDGREIFYRALDNRLIAADVDGRGPAFQVGTVRPLFNTRPGGPNYVYDATPDGQRFLINTLVEEAASAPITLVVNWPALLKN